MLWSTCFDWCPPPPSCCWNNDPPSWYWTSSLVPVVMLLDTVSNCFVSHMFQSRCLWVPGKNPLTLTWPKISDIFFLSSSLMSNARNWCKLTDGEQINTYHKQTIAEDFDKTFWNGPKDAGRQSNEDNFEISFSTFTDNMGRYGSPQQSSQNIVDRLFILNSFLSNLAILRPLSFANLWQSKKNQFFLCRRLVADWAEKD